LIRYRDAEIDAPKDTRIQFNMGNVFYRQGKFEEAEAAFVAATLSGDDISKADAHYNIGNSHFKLNRYDKAVESYQRALELNPGDRDAKFNLELVQKLLNRAAENAQSGPSQQRKPSSWARDRMREAESLAQQGKYGAAHQIIARTFQTEPTAAGEFGDFAGRVSDLRAVFGDGR
jgi:Ca-activated chloride channel family protein